MAEFPRNIIQDTTGFVRVSNDSAFSTSTTRVSIDSVSNLPEVPYRIVREQVSVPVVVDTTLVCQRNSIADVTLSDSAGFIHYLNTPKNDKTIYLLASNTRKVFTEKREALTQQLKDGKEIATLAPGYDWIIFVLVISAFLISVIGSVSNSFKSALRFLSFRRLIDPDYGETGSLFHWQSTLQNIVSFAVIGLFIYNSAAFYNSIPSMFNGFVFWAIIMTSIIIAFTLRYAICAITGSLSNQREAFNEYMSVICQTYHIGALLLFILTIFIAYITIIPVKALIISGFVILGLMYVLRVLRLLIIFMNRNISFFYLILYLCALEILPVAVAIRYFSGPN
ncbi:MAG TPA: DUF4271 domain-containing protein [Bacteroidales bacterium]|nr:DUF4271 domain-containing protein [Bacteroidales bacterium]